MKWVQLCSSLNILWHFPFLRLEWKLTFLQYCGHCWPFQISCHIECSTLIVSPFRIWNSSVSIPSLPRALFMVMLHKAHWASHSRISGSRWVITPSCLSGLLRDFLNSSYVYSWHLFLISSVPVRSGADCVVSAWVLLPQPKNAHWLSVGGVRFWIGIYSPTMLPGLWLPASHLASLMVFEQRRHFWLHFHCSLSRWYFHFTF